MRFVFAFFFFLLCQFSGVNAHAAFAVPPLTGPVVDNADLIRTADEQVLRKWIEAINASGAAQIQILTVPNLGGQTIEQASIEVTDDWKIGDKKKDNGILIMIASDERKIRIEVGQGLEGSLPDVYASRIIRETMTPLFQQGSSSQGILLGTYQVIKVIDPEFNADEQLQQAHLKSQGLFGKYEGLFIFIFVILVLFMRAFFLPRSLRQSTWVGRGGWGGGGFGGFGGGGGGWSGGGGGFSGGGSSGGW